jgi:hypothetical protein
VFFSVTEMAAFNLPEDLKDLIGSVESGEDGKKFLCKKCDKKYVNFFSAKQHVLEKHSSLNVVSCLIRGCEESFQNLNQMRTHCVMVHGEGPQPCPSQGCTSIPPGIARSVYLAFGNVCKH